MKDEWAKRRAARLAAEDAQSKEELLRAREAIQAATRKQQEDLRWMLSEIRGPQGPEGPTGRDGEPGVRGERGYTGATGPSGRDGIDGTNGIDGIDGIDGAIGVPGRNGIDGRDGRDGLPGVYSVSAAFLRDEAGQRIEGVVESLSDGSSRKMAVVRDERGRPTGLTLQ